VLLSLAKFETESTDADDVDADDLDTTGGKGGKPLTEPTRKTTRKIIPIAKYGPIACSIAAGGAGKTPSKKATLSAEKVTTDVQQKVTNRTTQPKKCTRRRKVAGTGAQNMAKDKTANNAFIPLLQLPYGSASTTTAAFTQDLGFGFRNLSTATSSSSDLDFQRIQRQVDDTHRVVSSINNKLDLHQQNQQSISSEERLLNAEILKQQKLATALVEERLRTKEIFNDQIESTLNLQQYHDQRDRIQHEQKMKQQMAESDAEAYRISKMITAKASDPLLKEKEAHKRKIEEMQAVAQCQIELMRATTACNVNASIMNNRVNINDQSVYDEVDVDKSVHNEEDVN
jgi:hypothetical protein